MELLPLSFLAGVLTVLSPCVLPLLPVIIGGSVDDADNRWRPVVITGSLAVSIIAFTLLLKWSTALIGIPQTVWTSISGVIILLFGVITLFPSVWERFSDMLRLSSRTQQSLQQASTKRGWSGSILMGFALGPVFSSCSPTYALILATVLPQSFIVGLLNLIAYSLGLAVLLLIIALLGQRAVQKLKWATDPTGWFKRGLGILFIIVGLAIITGLDKQLEIALLDTGQFDLTSVELQLLGTDGTAEVIE